MKNLVLAAILGLLFAGCAANKPAPAEQNAHEYRHATQTKDASCPHHGMPSASCAQSHAAMKECPHHGNHGADKNDKSYAKGKKMRTGKNMEQIALRALF